MSLSIQFDGEAGEAFARMAATCVGYTIGVEPLDGSAPFDARLLGPSSDEWHDGLRVQPLDEMGAWPLGEPRELRVRSILIY